MDERIRRVERARDEGGLDLVRLIAARLRAGAREPLVQGFVDDLTSEGTRWIAEEGELGFLGTEAFVQLLIEAGLNWEEAYGFSYDDRMQERIVVACGERARVTPCVAPAELRSGSGVRWSEELVGAPALSDPDGVFSRWCPAREPPSDMGWEALLERRFR